MIQPITLNGSNVTAENDAYINHAIHRTDGIVEFGNSMSAEIITNNSIKIKDGLLINQGRYMRIVPGSYETVQIENGKSRVNRIDLIVARFVADGATETHTIEVIKGDANGTKPTVTTGDTFNGATINEIPLYSVHLTGLNITKVQRELDLIKNTSDVVHMGYDSEGKPFTIKYYSKNDIASYIYQNRLVVNKGFIKHYGEYADFSMTITLKVTTSTELTMFDFPFYEFGKISSSVAGAVINNSRLNDDGGGSGVKKIGGYNISTQGENNSLYIQGFVSGDVVTFSGRLYFKV